MKFIKLIFIVINFITLIGCMQKYLYVMPAAHTHLMSKANEFQVEVYSGNSWDFQAAWSPRNHFSIYCTYETNTSYLNIDYSYQDLALGTYFNMDSMNIEILAGLGNGKSNGFDRTPQNLFKYNEVQLNGKYTRSFFQINVGRKKGWFSGGMAFRLSHVNFSKLKRSDGSFTEILKDVSENYLEPIGFIRFGWTRFGIKAQVGYPIRIGPEESSFDAYFYHLSLGIYLNLGGK
jgi:hypothetical protein